MARKSFLKLSGRCISFVFSVLPLSRLADIICHSFIRVGAKKHKLPLYVRINTPLFHSGPLYISIFPWLITYFISHIE